LQGKIRHGEVMGSRERGVVNGGMLPAFWAIPASISHAWIGGTLGILAGMPDDYRMVSINLCIYI
jgi:hypothetical protein